MSRKMVWALLPAVIGLLATTSAGAISVDTTYDPSAWISTILGPGVSIVPGSVLYAGGATSTGVFTDGLASGIGISRGLMLTSGDANLASTPNTVDTDAATGSWWNPETAPNGDPRLDALSGNPTYDASILEFDFVLEQDQSIFFNYVFASEEYNEWTNSPYNDVFGFFLDGQNIALIPGTTTPVAINNVNGGNPVGTNSSYPQYFNNNDPSDLAPVPYNIQYDGFTDVFTAVAQGLQAGHTYHMALGVADGSDSILDSAVFIQAGTFSNHYTHHEDGEDDPRFSDPVPEPASLALMGLGLLGLAVPRKLRKARK